MANRETGAELRASDRFRAGSITKTFVAAVVLQLAAERRLELDDPVESWLPGLVDERITVRQLLSHRSGLADYVDDEHDRLGRHARATGGWPRRHSGERRSPRPASATTYASTNYLVLGLLVERITGNDLAHELRTRIFRPLGLRTTRAFEPDVARLRVHGYRPAIHDGIVSGEPEDTAGESAAWLWSAGAIVSDADDLTRFFDGLVTGRVVREPLLAEMIPAQGYGLGLAAFTTPCGTAIGHSGNVSGYVSIAWVDHEAKRTVVLMANSYPLRPEADAAVHRALDDAFCGAAD